MNQPIAIVGGGIAGLSAAISLQQRNIPFVLFESAPQIGAVGAGLALAANAIYGFRKLGMAEKVIAHGRELAAFTIYRSDGKVISSNDSLALNEKYGVNNFTIHRADLHRVLLAEIDPTKVVLNKKAIGFDRKGEEVVIKFEDGSEFKSEHAIVSDGIHSAIRKQLIPNSQPRYAGYSCWRGVVDNSQMQLMETSETWGTKGRFGICPLAHNKVYWFACINGPQNNPNFKAYTKADLLKHFGEFHTVIPELIRQTPQENIIWGDIIDLKPIDRFNFDNILLIGDAAHATTPNMGQGACQAIEDAAVLADLLDQNMNIQSAFDAFTLRRIKRVHFIVNTSWQLGKIAQLQNPFLAGIRNAFFKSLPKSFSDKQLEVLYKVDF